ncbi:MAG: hydantoin racemase [marine bacterium B5-7]|nr:MAG: hydantoin racemase [marine bacterium B5-7]
MKRRVLVINPNSSDTVTNDIAQSVASVDHDGLFSFECVSLEGAPSAIESDHDVETVIPLIRQKVLTSNHDDYVLACFSDPGIADIREASRKSIFGIGECAYLQAMSQGRSFGVISILPVSKRRQIRYLDALGFISRMAGNVPLNLGVSDLASTEKTRDRILAVGDELIANGADVLILGCAGMAGYQGLLKEQFNVPVIEPTIAAILCVIQHRYFS